MDATHYEKIADKLMQFRGKIPPNRIIHDPTACMLVDELKYNIDQLLKLIDEFALHDAAGWIR